MSIKGIIDTCVHVQSFRNIDLYEQGVYMIGISVKDSSARQGSPYLLDNCVQRSSYARKYQLLESTLEDTSFYSRAFLIKYAEEEVRMNDLAIFRSELDRGLSPEELEVSVQLFYADIKVTYSEEEIVNNPPSREDFSMVSSLCIVIPRPFEGVNQFIPIQFSDLYPCQVNLCIHVIQLDFRYRFDTNQSNSESKDLTKLQSDIIFHGKQELTSQEIDQAYVSWVQQLIGIYEKNRKLLETFARVTGDPDSPTLTLTNPIIKYSEICTDRQALLVTARLVQDMQSVSEQLHLIELAIIETVKQHPAETSLLLQREYVQRLKEHWGGCIFRDAHSVSYLSECSVVSSGSHHDRIAEMVRKTPQFANTDLFEALQSQYFTESKFHPVLFQDIFYTPEAIVENDWDPDWFSFMPNPSFKRKGLHLIVFVHGFQGSSFDVKIIKNCIASLRPDCSLLCSNMNEGETEGDIADMGKRLAIEVTRHIKDWCPSNMLKKISFIGHSLGGVIIRAALHMLLDYSHMFHMFITFSSPHLGYMYNNSTVVGAGMWILKKWRKSECLQQLSISDSYDLRQSFLYQLSLSKGLQYFKHIALVGSYQDSYAPYESARIEVTDTISSDKTRGPIYTEMANNITQQISTNTLYRLDVSYKPKSQTIDHWIGRSAHIEMLENENVIQMILFSCAHFFE